ncbi:MAG: PLP-dependent lyase/thiolase [Streptosporangiaceae bacterium]
MTGPASTGPASTGPASTVACAGCGTGPAQSEPCPFRCPREGTDDVDHVLVRTLDISQVRFPAADDSEPEPFVRYRALLHSYHRAIAGGLADAEFCDLVRRLDDRVAQVDGHGFTATPLRRDAAISAELGFAEPGGVWVKDETHNVSGSHKGRHLMGVLLHLAVAERLGLGRRARPELAIASCGNAALAAAVLARAADWPLQVFVLADADLAVVARLRELGARVMSCPRVPGEPGDPSYRRLLRELAAGAVPFTCQGNLNGMAIEGGQTLGYELARDLRAAGVGLDHLVVQVGGGALASACIAGTAEAAALGAAPGEPRVHTVQTQGAHPLERAYARVCDTLPAQPSPDRIRAAVAAAAQHRSAFMWPWEAEPKSMAGGILDDETYDWRAVVEGMLRTGGRPVVVSEEQVAAAHRLGRRAGYQADPTGTSGLAGLLELRAAGAVRPADRIAVLFTGITRTAAGAGG